MSDFLTALHGHLTGTPALAALVGTRVYPDSVPLKATLPAMSYLVVDGRPLQHRSSRQATFGNTLVQLDIYGATRADAQAVRKAVLEAMGTFFGGGPPRVDVALRNNEQAAYEPETGRYRSIIEFRIWHEEG